MKLLALDTATEACSAALYIDGEITAKFQLAPREHTKLILKMIEDLLAEAGLKVTSLDAIAFGRGPGSFSGVRIATGVTHGLAFAADLPVIPVSTLASIAQSTYNDHHAENVLAGIDARMGEIYWGCYQIADNGLMILNGDEQVSSAELIQLPDDKQWIGSGSAWKGYPDQLNQRFGSVLKQAYAEYLPHSSSIVQLAAYEYSQGSMLEASQAQPVYLRNDVAKKSAQQKSLKNG